MGLSLKWDITYKCNLYCGHCLNADLLSNTQSELSTYEIKNIINKLGNIEHLDYVHLLGGEPVFRKDILDIVNCFDKNNIKFGFNTNGLLLTSNTVKKILFNKSLKNVVISLEGPTAEINDKIRGKNVFDIVVPKLKQLVAFKKENNLNNFTITINTVVSKENLLHIIDMINFCIDLGVDELSLLQLIPTGNAEGKNLSLSENEELSLVKDIALIYDKIKNKIKLTPKFVRPIVKDYCEKCLNLEFPDIPIHACGAGIGFGFINNKGYLSPCDRYLPLVLDKLSHNRIDLTKRDFYDIWGEEIFNQPFEFTRGDDFLNKFTPCNQCKYLKTSCYPCIVYGLNSEKVTIKSCEKYFKLIQEKEGDHNE